MARPFSLCARDEPARTGPAPRDVTCARPGDGRRCRRRRVRPEHGVFTHARAGDLPNGGDRCQRCPVPETGRSTRASLVLDAPRSQPVVAIGQESRTTSHTGTLDVMEADASVGDAGPAVAG